MMQVLLSTLSNVGDYAILALFFLKTSKKAENRTMLRIIVAGVCAILATTINQFNIKKLLQCDFGVFVLSIYADANAGKIFKS